MKAMIIGAGSEALHTIDKAHKHGLSVTALDGNPAAEGLREADKGLVVDISKEAAVIETAKREKPDFVLTAPIGRYLTTVGAVNDALNLPGISRQMAVLCTDKYQFYRKLQVSGLREGRCYAVGGEDGTGIRELKAGFAEGKISIGFPAILKPRFGSGSRGIRMIRNEEELHAALDELEEQTGAAKDAAQKKGNLQIEECVLEECAQGEEYGADGAVIRGRFHMVLLRKKENTPPPTRQAVGYFSVLPEDEFWQQAGSYMESVVRCLGLEECLLHADLIRSSRGPFVIEMSARPSGHNLHNLFTPLCTGIDMAEEYIRYRMGLEWNFDPAAVRRAAIHYFDLTGKAVRVPEEDQVRQAVPSLLDWKCNIAEGEMLAPVSDGHSLMGRGYFILEGDKEELAEKIEKIKALFKMA